jgi:hypothetical protein
MVQMVANAFVDSNSNRDTVSAILMDLDWLIDSVDQNDNRCSTWVNEMKVYIVVLLLIRRRR